MSLQKEMEAEVVVSLVGDAVFNAMAGQKTPNGYYNIERMLKAIMSKKGLVKL